MSLLPVFSFHMREVIFFAFIVKTHICIHIYSLMLACSSYFHRFFISAQFTGRVFPARYSLSGQTIRNQMCNRPLLVICFFLENFPLNVPMSFFSIKAQYHNRTLKWIRTNHFRNFRLFTRTSYVNSELRLNFTRIEAKS